MTQTESARAPRAYLSLKALRQGARAALAGGVGPTGRAVRPGQAAVAGGAVGLALLSAPQLAAHQTLRGVSAPGELLSKGLLALAVEAVGVAWGLHGQGHGLLWGV